METLKNLSHNEIFDSHRGPVDPGAYNMAAYMRCTQIRVMCLYEALRRRGLHHGSILEVGSFFGCFALLLARLGYGVTAVDRYQSYSSGFSVQECAF
jgi:hypothetical protein